MKNIAIYGAGIAGKRLAFSKKFLESNNIICFFDRDPKKINHNINGYQIFDINNVTKIINTYKITEIILAIPSLDSEDRIKIFNDLLKLPVKITTTPSLRKILLGKENLDNIHNINLNDIVFLEKGINKQIQFNNVLLSKSTILITGAGGSIGSELSRQIFDLDPKKIILVDHNENSLFNISVELNELQKIKKKINKTKKSIKIIQKLGSLLDLNFLAEISRNHKIHHLFHTAAYKHVHMVQINKNVAMKNNVLGTYNLIKIFSNNKNLKTFQLISSDKAVEPANYMGESKKISEQILEIASKNKFEDLKNNINKNIKYSSIRFGNVIGSSGSVLPIFKKQIVRGGPVTITDKRMTRFMMSLSQATKLILLSNEISQKSNYNYNCFFLAMGKPVKIIDIARRMIEYSGYTHIDKKSNNYLPIKIIGKKPGEKIHEKLYSKNEYIKNTKYKKIIRVLKKDNIHSDYQYIFSMIAKFKSF